MHYIDRSLFASAPITVLTRFHIEEQPKWLQYINWLKTRTVPVITKPSSKWTIDTVRVPLTQLFNNNCGYCGVYSNKNHDGEVDHFFPKELDVNADFIYSWDNYIWSCHSCNNKKRSNFPLINPCDDLETNEIYFHAADGRYIVKASASQGIKDKYMLTDRMTYLNGKQSPNRRKFIAKHLKNLLLLVYDRVRDYEIELISDSNSISCIQSRDNLNESIFEIKEYLKSEDFILLKKKIFKDFRTDFPEFTYDYVDFK